MARYRSSPAITRIGGALKVAKKVLKKAKNTPNKLATSASKEYHSKGKTGILATLPQRNFSDDYGHTTGELGQGPLKYTIEGRRLDAPFVVGRQSIGKGDKGLREEELFKVAEKIVDKVEAVPRQLLPKGSSGTY
ncbi:MAG: hypothetical protein HN687_02640 [Candidatus Marinimicrobia bacterium]|nr:hypothetical protein [Candidatus Neomarinimicrobiota bacterium]MBT7013536.1 hypothetical protein [Actinomycetota bacterium]MBT7973032.1 hypothetical protein [Candidatus Neomarinimicrobiota bacterium]